MKVVLFAGEYLIGCDSSNFSTKNIHAATEKSCENDNDEIFV